jgi:uncharacterized membrane protein
LLGHKVACGIAALVLVAVASGLMAGGACSDTASIACPNDYPATCPSGASTFAAEVAPLMHGRCTTCHAAGQQLPTMDTYLDIRAAAPGVLMQLTQCPPRMPPAPNPPLSADQRRTILSWLACGATDN